MNARWGRVRLRFARGLAVEFSDRRAALRQIEGLAERGTRLPVVIYGPEGCGKTALFRQAFEILKAYGYSVVYVNPAAERSEERVFTTEDVKEVAREVAGILHPVAAILVEKAIELASRALKSRRRVAVILDDTFQAVSAEKAEIHVKMLLNMIEYPPAEYESVVAIVGSSEGITRTRVGRHRWADIYAMWNMLLEGFEELYRQLPEPKPDSENVWRKTGGNPAYLAALFEQGWSAEAVVEGIIKGRRLRELVDTLTPLQLEALQEAVHDPDALSRRLREAGSPEEKEEVRKLLSRLVELNLLVDYIPERRESLWIDEPPPERDPGLGVGRLHAWQTPLHREAVRRVLGLPE